MGAGRSGGCGKSVPGAVAKGTGQGAGPAVTPRLSMEGSPVRAVLWSQSCAILGLAQVRKE